MAVNPSPFGPKPQFMLATGAPAVGAQLFWYVAGSVGTKQNTYTDSTGGSANANPIVMNALGEPTTQIWLTAGVSYKAVLAPSTDTDPPTSPIWTIDNLKGINDTTTTQDQWLPFTGTPTYVSATSFTLVGDQTSTFGVGRRVKTTNTGGTVISTITASTFGAVTTVVVANDSGTLDSGLSAVSYGLLSSASDSMARNVFPTMPNLTGYIFGNTYSNNVTDPTNDIDIAAGGCTDSTGAQYMVGTALTKQSDATWAVGTNAGGLDTGAVGNSDYYIWRIKRGDTGVVDVLFSLSSTAPTMPANYIYKRLIGWIRRTGGTIVALHTYETDGGGIDVSWDVPTLDVSLANTLTTARRTDALKVPLNLSTIADINAYADDGAGGVIVWICCPDQTDAAPSASVAPLATLYGGASDVMSNIKVRTSATGTVASRANVATVNTYKIVTLGFSWSRRT
jgi:hypothetical protein